MNIKNWVVAARLRTLPLSLSAVLAGCFMGVSKSGISAMSLILFILIVMTAVLLQILSNFANDYGDAVSGVDSDNRIGPRRALQNGDMTMSEMKKGIVAVTVMALITGTASLFLAFGTDYVNIAVFVLLGALSVIAAITYTVGLVYGYKGLGDISVFIFFGLVAVMGSSFMLSGNISMESILWGITAGFMATLVLNVNNLRDYESDRVNGKRSLVVMMGLKGGKIYHALLILSALISALICLIYHFSDSSMTGLSAWISLIPIAIASVYCIHPAHTGRELDPMLKKTSIAAALANLVCGAVLAWC
ncbi:1,4-dihydroxy-2-naphthoate octaprenyltransferase [Ruminobacter sp. RM87]|uniref:1,4-dihydroxy-2-naphthoate octaprenyltransferase n=1 Tax=Ruminobacter sp. RM87 TaxID=1200567 RepID=UPI0004E21BDB|nr:1,4-dihydroxy-2-naphthoate octaprenyltransferase [Ruminobacter sp. RM87]